MSVLRGDLPLILRGFLMRLMEHEVLIVAVAALPIAVALVVLLIDSMIRHRARRRIQDRFRSHYRHRRHSSEMKHAHRPSADTAKRDSARYRKAA